MKLFFVVLDGPNKGQKTPIKVGLQIGRSAPGLKLKDPKASALHAEVQVKEDGSLWLVDKGSTNKIKTETGRKEQIELVADIEFTIGSTRLGVIKATKSSSTEGPVKQGNSPKNSESIPAWRRDLVEYLRGHPLRSRELAPPIGAFSPALELEFIEGYQTGTTWTLGYGPRTAGRVSPDLMILEKGAPDFSFELHPSRRGPEFKTRHPEVVRLNGNSISSETIKDGDIISVCNSKIRVRFL